jgi:prefoldin alpha subunit
MSAEAGGDPRQISEEIDQIEQQIESLQGNVQSLRNERQAVDEAMDALETIETGGTVKVPLGGEAYVQATIDTVEEVLVGIGGGYAAEQPHDDAVETLETRKDAIGDSIDELQEEIANLEEERAGLEQRAQQLQQQQMQQLQQQMGGLGGDE